MKKRVAIVGIVCAVLFGLGLATRTALNQSQKRPAYTIMWQETSYDSSGTAIPESVETKHVSASGNAYSVKRYSDGKVEEMFWIVGRGVYLKRGTKLHFMSDWSLPPQRSAEAMKAKNRYLRTETVLGVPAVVISPAKSTDVQFEYYFAAALNDEIKTVFRGPMTTIKEPVSLTFGEPDPKLFRFPEELKVDYTNYEKLHGPRKAN